MLSKFVLMHVDIGLGDPAACSAHKRTPSPVELQSPFCVDTWGTPSRERNYTHSDSHLAVRPPHEGSIRALAEGQRSTGLPRVNSKPSWQLTLSSTASSGWIHPYFQNHVRSTSTASSVTKIDPLASLASTWQGPLVHRWQMSQCWQKYGAAQFIRDVRVCNDKQ